MTEPIVLNTPKDDHSLIISYLTLRRMVGILGGLLPIILVLGNLILSNDHSIERSISHYYHTIMRNVFVGMLCSIGLFLICYKGYDLKDNILSSLAGIFAIGVAFIPTTPYGIDTDLIGNLHFLCASLFFLLITYFSLFLFTKYDKTKEITLGKRKQNFVYRLCGYTMFICILTIAIYSFLIKERFPETEKNNPIFWLESIALFAFGISWLVKGKVICDDIQDDKKV